VAVAPEKLLKAGLLARCHGARVVGTTLSFKDLHRAGGERRRPRGPYASTMPMHAI